MDLFKKDSDEEKEEKPSFEKPVEQPKQAKKSPSKRKGKVIFVLKGKRVVVDVNGMGESVPYNESLHANLKAGDEIEL